METSKNNIKLNSIQEAIEDIKNGKIIIVVDDEDRENEGDFIAAAESVTPEMVNFMAKHKINSIASTTTNTKPTLLNLHKLSGI